MQTLIKLSDEITLHVEWEGGPYIELKVNGWGKNASEVINVWDFDNSVPTIPFTRESLRSHVNQWIFGYGKEQLIHDIKNNWER